MSAPGQKDGDERAAPRTTRIGLPTGVTLTVALAGPETAPAIVFLHGFPETHRTWRRQFAALSDDFRLIAPDQRGFGGSDKPEGVEPYKVARIVEDLIALADALGLDRFTLVGHDWGGAIAWAAALAHPDRIERLVIVNAPHPLIFQKSLIDDPDQRAASQYIRAFRSPIAEAGLKAMGLEAFFDRVFGAENDRGQISEEDKEAAIAEWSRDGALAAMLNWYRASELTVPEVGEKAHAPLWTHLPFPQVTVPVLVIWGLRDTALLPVQLDGLAGQVPDLRIATVGDGGHFIPWQRPEAVTAAIRDFMAEG